MSCSSRGPPSISATVAYLLRAQKNFMSELQPCSFEICYALTACRFFMIGGDDLEPSISASMTSRYSLRPVGSESSWLPRPKVSVSTMMAGLRTQHSSPHVHRKFTTRVSLPCRCRG